MSREAAKVPGRAFVIAVDFDGTLCENKWPEIGASRWGTIAWVKAQKQARGAKIILWTNRVGKRLAEAVEWCRKYGIEFDAVNENLPEVRAAFITDTRKVVADVYLDDKAMSAAEVERIMHGVLAQVAQYAQAEQKIREGEGEE